MKGIPLVKNNHPVSRAGKEAMYCPLDSLKNVLASKKNEHENLKQSLTLL